MINEPSSGRYVKITRQIFFYERFGSLKIIGSGVNYCPMS
jgi:hypothetical protein